MKKRTKRIFFYPIAEASGRYFFIIIKAVLFYKCFFFYYFLTNTVSARIVHDVNDTRVIIAEDLGACKTDNK